MVRSRLRCALFTAIAVLSMPVWADNHALLVGVSTYPALKEPYQLNGPRNDVILMREVLARKGFAADKITVLADGVDGAALPTHANILTAFDRIAASVQPGDFVFMEFAGHGSQQPARPGKSPPEPDNLDEIFLPRDIGVWNGAVGQVQNALTDSEVNQAISRIRDKGAFVWVVFDSCHSASMSRGGEPDDVRYRHVNSEVLGITPSALAKAAPRSRGGAAAEPESANGLGRAAALGKDRAGSGGLVAFYAAQTIETTPEMRLPVTSMERNPHGLFTYTLAEMLERYSGISYRQLGQQILQRYLANGMRAPTPLFEGGALLDAPVFGSTPQPAQRQWPLKISAKGEPGIAVGQLQQFDTGAVFALHREPGAPDEAAIGYLEAVNVTPLTTQLRPIAYNDKPAVADTELQANRYARLVDPVLRLSLKVALPLDGGKIVQSDTCKPTQHGSAAQDRQQAAQALALLRDKRDTGLQITWVAPGQPADVRLLATNGKLWLLPPDGQWVACGAHPTPSIALDGAPAQLAQAIGRDLLTVAKAINILRLTSFVGVEAKASKELLVNATLVRHKDGKRSVLQATSAPDLHPGDRLEFRIENKSRAMVDVTLLFLDNRYGITPVFPQPGHINRIEAGGVIGGDDGLTVEIDASTTGLEHMVVLATYAEPLSPMTDFTFLAQERLRGIDRDRAVTRDIGVLFDAAGFGTQTRGVNVTRAVRETDVRVFGWKTSGK